MLIRKTDTEMIRGYFEDSSGLSGGFAEEVVLPENEKDVSEFLEEASAKGNFVTVSGGGTGVTGGRIPFGGSVLAADRFNKIIDCFEGGIIVQAGVPLDEIHGAADSIGYFYPPDATEQTAWIGGNIATNASGARSFKYGSTRNYVKSLKVALSNGEILDICRDTVKASNRGLLSVGKKKTAIPNYEMPGVKNAAGYFSKPGMDLIDLFIGSEGTLGVILEAELELQKKIGPLFGCFAFFEDENRAFDFVAELKKRASRGFDLLAIEYFDRHSLALLSKKYPNIPKSSTGMVFFEQEISPKIEDSYLEAWAEILDSSGVGESNTWMADDAKKFQELKDFRHSLPELVNETVKSRGIPKIGTDMAVPAENFDTMLRYYREHLEQQQIDHLFFGHIGENHLHVNVLPRNAEEAKTTKELYLKFVKMAVSLGGTVSAEHGIGKLKHDFLKEMYGDDGIMEMARVKKELDPACILGLGNIFPKELLF